MKDRKTVRILLLAAQILILFALNYIVPLSDSTLIFFGFGVAVLAYFLKLRYSGWVIVPAYPAAYALACLLDTPHPFDGRLPNNLYPLWYLIFIGSCIAFLVLELLIRFKNKSESKN